MGGFERGNRHKGRTEVSPLCEISCPILKLGGFAFTPHARYPGAEGENKKNQFFALRRLAVQRRSVPESGPGLVYLGSEQDRHLRMDRLEVFSNEAVPEFLADVDFGKRIMHRAMVVSEIEHEVMKLPFADTLGHPIVAVAVDVLIDPLEEAKVRRSAIELEGAGLGFVDSNAFSDVLLPLVFSRVEQGLLEWRSAGRQWDGGHGSGPDWRRRSGMGGFPLPPSRLRIVILAILLMASTRGAWLSPSTFDFATMTSLACLGSSSGGLSLRIGGHSDPLSDVGERRRSINMAKSPSDDQKIKSSPNRLEILAAREHVYFT